MRDVKNDAEYLGNTLSPRSDRFKRCNKVKEMKSEENDHEVVCLRKIFSHPRDRVKHNEAKEKKKKLITKLNM